ncbi:hypothetical protein COCVIDRAFT_26264 [Bipolaris victoriae FI3]|uniref:Uncharacterized protein n=1 Tax=Bipolaris victoriae (strain FI3) TaxID=930091 RepID=W7EKH4_BIPV3|nr:hypothetical protein COCVIDRAFT_26264 [Bipolaris victoriae FI3]
MAPCETKKVAKTKRIPPKVKRNTKGYQTRTSPQKSPSQTTSIEQEEAEGNLSAIPHHPKTPLNTAHLLSMPKVTNSIRRVEFREYVSLGITPLDGKGSRAVQGSQNITTPLIDEVDEEEIDEELERTWQDWRNDQESKELKWLREKLWGKGKWAVRTEHEEDVLYVRSVLGEEEWAALCL